MGGNAKPLIQKANPQPISDAIAARTGTPAAVTRVSDGLEGATGIDPMMAKATADQQVAEARAGPAKDAYDEALTGKPVWTPDLARLATNEPEIQTAMNWAARLLGERAYAPNPDAAPPPAAGGPQERMSVEELRARQVQAGTRKPGQDISTADLMDYLQKGSPGVTNVAPKEPPLVPTDEMWDQTKQQLNKAITKNSLGQMEETPENALRADRAQKLVAALDDPAAIGPAYAEARAVGGEAPTRKIAYDNGVGLWGTGAKSETSQSFADRYGKLTPAEQDATQRGYMSEFYKRSENNTLDPATAMTPRHLAVQETMFGPDGRRAIQETLANEQTLAAGAKGINAAAGESRRFPRSRTRGHGGRRCARGDRT